MKTNWPVKNLEDVTEFLDHLRVPVTKEDRIPGPYPYYGANGQLDSVNDYIFDDELVLLAEDGGHFGSKTEPIAYRVSGKCWVNNHAHVIKPKNGEVCIDFLGYSLMYYDVTPFISGSTRAKLNKTQAKKIPLQIPPKKIQKKIVERLDAIRKAQELNEKQISLTDELLNSLIRKEILDGLWKEIELKITVRGQEFVNPKKRPDKLFNYVEISSIHPETKQIIKFRQILGKKAPSRARKVVRDGDTVWSTVRPYLKNVVHVIHLPDPKVASTGFCVLSPKPSVIDHYWLYFNVSSVWFIKKVLPSQRGASYPAVSDHDILEQTIKLAPIKEQQKIVQKLKSVQGNKKLLSKRKELLQELFNSVLDKSMKGELD